MPGVRHQKASIVGTFMRFEGNLNVENDDFELEARPLILRTDEISFTLCGRDEYGRYKLEGVAHKTEHGFYLAPMIRLIYPEYDIDDCNEYATIRFDQVIPNKNSNDCKVSGVWKQVGGDEWRFEGVLT